MATSPRPKPPRGRCRFEARPLTARPGSPWGLFRVWPHGKEECVAYGARERIEPAAARLQAREDGQRPPPA